MDARYVSEVTRFRLDDRSILTFSRAPLEHSVLPTKGMLKRKITGVLLDYAFCGEQDFGINPLKEAFGATNNDGIITKIPSGFTVDTAGDVSVLKYGDTSISPGMYGYARRFGVAGYWDKENLIFCASKKYEAIILNLIDFFEPYKVRFVPSYLGEDLLITSC